MEIVLVFDSFKECLPSENFIKVAAKAILKAIGNKFPNVTLSIAEYITSITVFCDSRFVLLNSINKVLAKNFRLSITVTFVFLATELFSSHWLIPPAAGPIAADPYYRCKCRVYYDCGSNGCLTFSSGRFFLGYFCCKKGLCRI